MNLTAIPDEHIAVHIPMIESLLGKMSNNLRALTLEKEFVSIGQRLGFESAGDYRRKLEKQVSSLANENAMLKAKVAELMAKQA